MKTELMNRARVLAKLEYTVIVDEDETTSGRPIYVSRIAELDGCMAQAQTREEAERGVREAALDYIASLLEDGLSVPLPSRPITTSTYTSTVSKTIHIEDVTVDVAEESTPAPLYEFEFTVR